MASCSWLRLRLADGGEGGEGGGDALDLLQVGKRTAVVAVLEVCQPRTRRRLDRLQGVVLVDGGNDQGGVGDVYVVEAAEGRDGSDLPMRPWANLFDHLGRCEVTHQCPRPSRGPRCVSHRPSSSSRACSAASSA